MPTIRISEYTVLQIVGLDAAVLLNFYKMAFSLFSVCSLFAVVVLMPINLKHNIDIGDGRDDDDEETLRSLITANGTSPAIPGHDWLDLINDANSYLTMHLLFTYLFTSITLYFIHRNYKKFVRARQLFSLELVHSISARTVMVAQLPPQLRNERALAEYFEAMDMSVESVSVCREVESLKELLDERTAALLKLERAWVHYLGNPSHAVEADSIEQPLIDVENSRPEDAERQRLVMPNRKRPTLRPHFFGSKVDALRHLEEKFKEADLAVLRRRLTGKFKPTHAAFVTFEKMSSAQIAVQVVYAPAPAQCRTYLAPEPRDIIWANMTLAPGSALARDWLVIGAMLLLLFFWVIPVTALAGLLSYKEIKKTWPALARLIDANAQIGVIVQNSLPSVAVITLNACLPFLLESLTYIQGYKARSWIEYSLLKKYFLFLLTNVVFIFLFASTYWQLVRDLANSPAKIPEKLAAALQQGNARHFFVSYVILQGIGLMPLQLLNLGVIIPRIIFRMFVTRTPRDFAELNAPPMINYGAVYPQGILIFVITLLYSVVQPLIVIFGAIYFGIAYVVYKYKLLFVFYKPYESQGQAWPITFTRLIWGIIIYLVFMSGIFILRKSYVLSTLLIPLLGFTLLWAWYTDKKFKSLSKYVSLSSIFEVQKGASTAEVTRLRAGHPVTWSQSYLNHRRYAQNDDTLYVAPEDERTDYSQPPMANWYPGVLNTGKRRYGHPALNGVLPQPWLPLKKGQTLRNGPPAAPGASSTDTTPAVVLTLRKRRSVARTIPTRSQTEPVPRTMDDATANPWQDAPSERPRHLTHRLSFDHASGVIMLPEDGAWLDEETDSDEEDSTVQNVQALRVAEEIGQHDAEQPTETSALQASSSGRRYGTYYHHPERRKRTDSRVLSG
ncbi:uncharacterized protein PHACADRAFT_255901 [Phanerochaete carnosa HHB-10118-sp]|uniref:CSC1/OSCA1-like 7TM region domain-containing protein n=1 Tax=Phanerochaete carnosa (strain HHB-10118-sp) TaxID=650164 RepID=K5WXZ6_PHACS|nr:uncharacterized protein PHACADRAFT_255901 [Phanerochaete carnosa HHB-10118-sp]EKM55342.1 hypothetical protein PHACADRAFT_255901 [Phanerochaete carnosa HHB-10118-sp]